MLIQTKHHIVHLTAHVILVCKYRKKLLIRFGEEMKQLLQQRADISKWFEITTLEVDTDHVHMMIDYSPGETVQNIVKQLKSYTAFHMWQNHPELKDQFWKQKMFWSTGYFACSVGDASRETIQKYIETQGTRPQIKRNIHP